MLRRVAADRQTAIEAALAPLRAWARDGGDAGALRAALAHGVEGDIGFLLARPSLARLVAWEELDGGGRLRAVVASSGPLADAFHALRSAPRARGLRAFAVEHGVLLWTGMTYGAIAQRATLLRGMDSDLADPRARRRHVAFAVDQLLHLVAGDPVPL